jgi:hypothetical protein
MVRCSSERSWFVLRVRFAATDDFEADGYMGGGGPRRVVAAIVLPSHVGRFFGVDSRKERRHDDNPVGAEPGAIGDGEGRAGLVDDLAVHAEERRDGHDIAVIPCVDCYRGDHRNGKEKAQKD